MPPVYRALYKPLPAGYLLAPIQPLPRACLRLCVLIRTQPNPGDAVFVLLRDLPLASVYLGAVCDQAGRLQNWVEVWVQTSQIGEISLSERRERVSNNALDQRWILECDVQQNHNPGDTIITGFEKIHPKPLLIKSPQNGSSGIAVVEEANWELCLDDTLLASFGLPEYDTSIFRYLHQPVQEGPKTFLATSAECPVNSHVQGLEKLKETGNILAVFNPPGGFLRVSRFSPLNLEDYLGILEGRAWEGAAPGAALPLLDGIDSELQSWSSNRRGMPFLVHGAGSAQDRMNEIFFLKLSILLGMLKEVRSYVAAQQCPILDLSPASFAVELPPVGEQLPALWSARCRLIKMGQGHPLLIKSTQLKYFIRLGRVEPSVFLPEGLGAHSLGSGAIRKRDVRSESDGIVFEGTLIAEDYLGLDPYDLLWFKLPIGDHERLEFYAHVYKGDSLGPKEARFRTVPARLEETVIAVLKTTGVFARAPYEIWPLLSSPCDLYSLGVIAVRVLLANGKTALPVVLDELLGLARLIGKDLDTCENLLSHLATVLQGNEKLRDLVSPDRLTEAGWSPAQARDNIHPELWLETIAWMLRLFPGVGPMSYCKDFGDVSPLALETVFDPAIDELEHLLIRLRSILLPTAAMNAELSTIILEQLAELES
jgi:hypothetical protein